MDGQSNGGGMSSSSTELPDLHSDAMDPYHNGVDEIDLGVLANPNKIETEIQKLSEHEDVSEEELMHFDEVSQNANDILAGKMESAGFHDNPQQNINSVVNPASGFVPSPTFAVSPPKVYGEEDDDVPGQDFAASFHNKFTAPQSEIETAGIVNKAFENDTMSQGRTQPVRVNFGDNVVNTFDNSVMAATQAQTMPGGPQQQLQSLPQQPLESKNVEASSSSRSSRSKTVSSHEQTESDASAHRKELKERQRQQRKKEKRRRERLPHERTYGELQEERYEDWEKKIQNDVQEAINTEKRELLLLFAEKEAEGYKMNRKFTMASDINEMRFWFYKLLRDSRTDDEVAHLRSHLVEGTRLLLTLNDKVFDNPLGLSDMLDFPDVLSSMLTGSWDRHIRDYVKSKHSLQGPPPQPIKNLGLNLLHLFISHHRKKAAEEQKEKAEREKMQREAVLAASKNGNLAQNPYDAIFGNYSTNLMRGREGINPMELPHYAQTMPQYHNSPDFQAFLQYKRAKEQAEFQEFMDAKSQSKFGGTGGGGLIPNNVQNTTKSVNFAARPVQVQPQPQRSTQSVAKQTNLQPPPSFLKDSFAQMGGSASPIPNDLGAPDVASIDASRDFRTPASHKDRVASSSTHASNSGLAGNSSRVSRSDKLLLSTSAHSLDSSTSSSSSMLAKAPQKPPLQLQAPTRSPPPNTLPRAYREISPGAQLLQKIGKAGGTIDERQIPLPPVPAITRESVQKLQEQLAAQANAAQKAQTVVQKKETENLKAIRPVDREKIAQLIQNAKPKPKFEPPEESSQSKSGSSEQSSAQRDVTSSDNTKSDSTNRDENSTDSGANDTESDYDRILREMEEECEEMDSEETVKKLNDVKFIPVGAHAIDNNSKDNRIIDMLKMFQSFMAEPPKGTRPTAQSSMFSNLDELLATDSSSGQEQQPIRKKKTVGEKKKKNKKRLEIGDSAEETSSPDEEDDENNSSNKSSSASFKLNSENQDLAKIKIGKDGRFAF